MKNYLETDYQKLLKRQADRLGVEVDDLRTEQNAAISHARAAERLGLERGISGSTLLANVFQLRPADITTSEACLRPRHVEAVLATGRLSPEHKTHLEQCASCQALVQAARVRTSREQQFLQRSRNLSLAEAERLESARQHTVRPQGTNQSIVFRATKVSRRLHQGGALQGIKRKDTLKAIKALVRMGAITPDGQLSRDPNLPNHRELVTRVVAESRITPSVATAVLEAISPTKRQKQQVRGAWGARATRILRARKSSA
jgi:hypothetical protein